MTCISKEDTKSNLFTKIIPCLKKHIDDIEKTEIF